MSPLLKSMCFSNLPILSIFQAASMALQNIIFVLLGYWASGLPQTIGDFLMIIIITILVSTVVCAFGKILF